MQKVHYSGSGMDHFGLSSNPFPGLPKLPFDYRREHINALANLTWGVRRESKQEPLGPWAAQHEAPNGNRFDISRGCRGRDRVGVQPWAQPPGDMRPASHSGRSMMPASRAWIASRSVVRRWAYSSRVRRM
jgi:hypothetical protein